MLFFDNVKQLVREKNMTIDGMMKEALGPTSGRDIFNGWQRRGLTPRADDCLRVAKVLGVSVEYLLTGKDSQYRKYSDRAIKVAAAFDKASARRQEAIEELLDILPLEKNNQVSS